MWLIFEIILSNKHLKVDDYPYGGGAGMVLQPQPIFEAVEHVTKEEKQKKAKNYIDVSTRGTI